ncbi:hypothetical protein A3C21_00215 [Candidatus Kaiserbacteria bacterium RIFCSPHIGHO2_02_FULL_59_21]|uniref:Recombination protein RecR n=2 Tax=Candidatus Kaiseribacteriota TaxID=1752734 RepID=A0A0G2B0F8_9BACT|nr:MAG: Recombination protein RecR [Candidatus Kaiserbacteria bacterium GW2011_GWA2_58_9]OGG62540.1 MAG: hypothetical protein A2766_01050 [Candidatus Kaiserbacteria bacterium RIFCSPHIGHO2_01_FULL_58_22]OGG67511.1 MAG: hypothetical protein A3C21_00215 [Candidatus Kaiserbacteria bacterium RIFCSPHIGHO2_02_FULL_59_21]
MDAIERLASLFEHFPGIGPRQAERFVQFLLRSSPGVRRELAESVQALARDIRQCSECMRFYSGESKTCGICASASRDKSLLAVVASDADLAALEKSGTYRGGYFVLGGTLDLASEKTDRLRVKQLLTHINDLRSRYTDLKEVILAFPANPEGDATAAKVREEILDLRNPNIKVTTLGRGLSTGSELEYADPETIKSALEGRR